MRRRFDRHGHIPPRPQKTAEVHIEETSPDDFLTLETEMSLIGLLFSSRVFSSCTSVDVMVNLDDAMAQAEEDYDTLAKGVSALSPRKAPETPDEVRNAYKALFDAVTDHCRKMFPS